MTAFPTRKAQSEAKRILIRKAYDHLVGLYRQIIRFELSHQISPRAKERALMAFAAALDTESTAEAGAAFTASLFGRYGNSYAGVAASTDELQRVFGERAA